jgi:ribose transport system substrate-binding protein
MAKRIALALVAACAAAVSAEAADLRFAIVAPQAGSPFFDQVRDGCEARGKVLANDGGSITCLYGGPGFLLALADPAKASADPAAPPPAPIADTRTQAQIINDFASAHVDGIAVSPVTDPAVRKAVDDAVAAGIPVVTFETDVAGSARRAFIGTNARDFGRALGESLKRWKPKGGKFAILSTDPKQPDVAERIIGVRDGIGPGWSEIVGSPVVTSGDFGDAVDRIDGVLGSYFDVDAVISIGAWPMLASDRWREMVAKYKSRIDQAQVVLVVADALPAQKQLVREGLGHVLVGQQPDDMGARLVDVLFDLRRGRRVADVTYVGFDTFTRLDLVKPAN